MIIPEKLQPGDTIGIISPSSGLCGIFEHRVEKAVAFLESLGLRVKFAPYAKENAGYVSASIDKRVEDLHSMFLDTEVKAIICSLGGNHSNQLLKYIDFQIIKNNPKIFIGYSDISVLHYAIQKETGLQTYYGPCIISELGENKEPFEYTVDSLKHILFADSEFEVKKINYYTDELLNWVTKEDLKRERSFKDIEGFKVLRPGTVQGKIIGGCIPSINHLLGTKYWIAPKGKVFFIDIPEGFELGKGLALAELDSYLTDLDNIGVFQEIIALLVSVPYGYSLEEQQELEKLILRFVIGTSYPVIINLPFGHTDPMLTIPFNGNIKIDEKILLSKI